MPVRTYLSQVILWFRRLSTRERILVTILASAFLMLIPVYIGTSIRDITKTSETKVIRARADFQTLQSSIDRYKQLRSKRDELTTKYLSSSVTYEKLTSYLDRVVKRELSDATYELKPSKDDVKISDNFLAKKYSLKIKEALFAELPSLLKSLEDGPPPLFIQRMDISKSPSLGKISIQLEVVTIEEGKPESDLGAP